MPCRVGSTVSATRATRSWRCRQATRSAMVMTGRPLGRAERETPRACAASSRRRRRARRWRRPVRGRRGGRGRRRPRCDRARTSTPPARARSGTTWPGRTRSAGPLGGVREGADRAGAVGGRDARRHAGCGVDGDGVCRAQRVAVVAHHEGQREPVGDLLRHGGADVAGGVPDRPGQPRVGQGLRGEDDVALVLAVLVVEDEHRATLRAGRRGPARCVARPS